MRVEVKEWRSEKTGYQFYKSTPPQVSRYLKGIPWPAFRAKHNKRRKAKAKEAIKS